MVDDEFYDFEAQFADMDESAIVEDVVSLEDLTTKELSEILFDINEKLIAAQEGLNPHTQWARDLHSKREAVRVILAHRTRG